MHRPRARKPAWLSLLILFASIIVWFLNHSTETGKSEDSPKPKTEQNRSASAPRTDSPSPEKVGSYEIYRNCQLVKNRSNDGDSFLVRLPDDREVMVRLYFVDAPESAFKRYGGGETNFKRISDQAADLGNITPEQAVEIGVKAKNYSLQQLSARPFTIHTAWDSPFKDNRFHAFVEIQENGKPRWLHERLIELGLARIKTKPADLPDGTPAEKQREHLRSLERKSRKSESGVWGL
jgi:endonuclease YncB( thermonuclease family)